MKWLVLFKKSSVWSGNVRCGFSWGILARRHCGGASWLVWCAGRSGEDDMNSLHRNPDGRVSIWSSEQALCEEDGPQCGEVLCDQQCSLVWYGPVKMDWLVLVMSSWVVQWRLHWYWKWKWYEDSMMAMALYLTLGMTWRRWIWRWSCNGVDWSWNGDGCPLVARSLETWCDHSDDCCLPNLPLYIKYLKK